MTNLERLAATLANRPVDRVLTYDLLDNREVLRRYGGWESDRRYAPAQLAEANARALSGIGIDVTRGVYDPVDHWMAGKIANWIRFLGVDPGAWKVEQTGGTAWIAKRPFTDVAGLERNMPSLPDAAEVEAWYGPWIEQVSGIYAARDVVMIGGVEGPLSDAYTYTDTELFMYTLYDAPELAQRLMEVMARFSEILAEVFARRLSAPLQFMGEDCAFKSGPMFDPAFVRRSALPLWRRIKAPMSAAGGSFLFHTDGRYGALLPLIFDELGAEGLNPVEPNGCNDIFEIAAAYPDRVYFGNVCCSTTLPFGNVFDVEDEALELLERLPGEGRRVLVGSSSEIHDNVPLENAEALYRAVKEYGEFPIDLERIGRRRREIRGRLTVRKRS